MISEIVSFKIPTGMSREEILEDAKTTIERWSNYPGLLRKTYVRADETTCMGIYLWESKDDAQNGHDEAWLARAEEKWGNKPTITYYDAFMELDNRLGQVYEFPED
ncbi:MAG: hypothetical protein OQK35_02590 [Alphaproteobacteria bacterium]|nr:hypothetical protein [Rhodospirillales bacterium]MCW9045196.1 hypothetical protein [Alphaproteobacteria bacterium]